MNAPDPGTKLNIIYDKNPLFAFDSAVSTSSAKSYRNDGLIGRYIMLQASSLLKFREIAIFNSRNQLESSTRFHVKKGVATESLECPASHPYAFRGGSQCCAGYRERDDSTAPDSDWPSKSIVFSAEDLRVLLFSELGNRGQLLYDSQICGKESVSCPHSHGRCYNYNFWRYGCQVYNMVMAGQTNGPHAVPAS